METRRRGGNDEMRQHHGETEEGKANDTTTPPLRRRRCHIAGARRTALFILTVLVFGQQDLEHYTSMFVNHETDTEEVSLVSGHVHVLHVHIYDSHFMCPTWAEQGRCDNVDYLSIREEEEYEEIYREEDAQRAHTSTTIESMCQRSCLIQTLVVDDDEIQQALKGFTSDGIDDITIGVAQEIDLLADPLALETLVVLRQTIIYMQHNNNNNEDSATKNQEQEVVGTTSTETVTVLCHNLHRDCSWRAAAGYCTQSLNLVQMQLECSPACRTCDILSLRQRCPLSPESLLSGPAALNMNGMFERIVQDDAYSVQILSQQSSSSFKNDPSSSSSSPWILRLDEFLSREESQHLIGVGHAIGFETSTIMSTTVSDDDDDDADVSEPGASNIVDQQHIKQEKWRTSETAWCDAICQLQDPVVNAVVNKIAKLIEMPRSHMERLQLLKYEPGQFYVKHNDYREAQRYLPCGPRILTLLLYLNDVPEGSGGETRFFLAAKNNKKDTTTITVDVRPRQGAALLWPNVLPENPLEIDERTFHEALPVTSGVKYAANVWFHLYDYDAADKHHCT
jgi:hypothetical protein